MAFFALELTHPALGPRRVEFVTPTAVTLLTDGRITRDQVGNRLGNPEGLFFQRWLGREEELSFFVVGERGRSSPPPPRPAALNDQQVLQGKVKHGDVMRWREFKISVVEIGLLGEPELAMAEAARASDAALHVYADWLETKGATQGAEWARLMLSPLGEAEKERMNALAARLGGSFRSSVARGPVERCSQSPCGQRWEQLPLLGEPCRRVCSRCSQRVTWCEDAEGARSIVGPVVLDPATVREPGDLLPHPIALG